MKSFTMQNILSSITSIGQHQSQLIRLLTNKWNNKILFSSVVFSVSDRLEPGRASPSARWPGCRSSQTPEPTAWPRDVHSTGRWQNSKTRPLNTYRGKKTTIYLLFFEIKVIMNLVSDSKFNSKFFYNVIWCKNLLSEIPRAKIQVENPSLTI